MRSALVRTVGVLATATRLAITSVVVAVLAFVVPTTPGSRHEMTTGDMIGVDARTSPTDLGMAFPADVYSDDPATFAADLTLVAGIGMHSIRLPVFWGLVQPTDAASFDWTTVDRLVDEASRRDLTILASVGSTPAWAAARGARGPYAAPADPAACGKFVSAVAERYRGRIRAYEIWNEPNGALFYDPRPDPVAYTALLKAGYRAVKQADPTATVVGGALGAVVDSAGTADPVPFLRQMYDAGAKGSFDALSFHPYKYDLGLGESWTIVDSPGQQLSAMRELMISEGDGAKKIWATEFGTPTATSSPQQQSAQFADFAHSWRQLPYAGPVFLFTLRDRASGNGNVEDNFGLLQTDRRPKDAMWRVAGYVRFGIPAGPAERAFADARTPDPAWGEALSPVVPMTRSGVQGRFYQRATVYRTPQGVEVSPAPVAALLVRADTYPVSDFVDGHQDLASGARLYFSEKTGAHIIGGGVVAAWTRAFGLALTDEVPVGEGKVEVEFQHGIITWSSTQGAIAMRS